MSPDGSSKPLPEEKLLRLIRGKGPKRDASPAGGSPAVVTIAMPRHARPGATTIPWLPVAVGMLVTILAVEIVALAVQLLRPVPAVTLPAAPAPAEPPQESAQLPPMPSLTQSAPPQLFTVPAGTAGTAAADSGARPVRTGPTQAAQQLAERLTLMGIISGDPPQAIIEDGNSKKSLFVTVGQPVAEGAMLDEILDNRVILDFNGEKIELTL